ncbi:MAG TPA: glycosyltransferase family 2 protein [Alphaproteobacteria bacterium]|nr:glycosyltransferase family 2 protein [Alphaproteobacteria bacterium]
MENPEISIVIPVFNEADNILPLCESLRAAMQETSYTWEVIFVDDGSVDGTYGLLERLHRQDERVCVVRFRRNFGQTAAMAAGLDHAQGDIIVTLDGDLQNDPADIPSLIRKLEEGYDLASGWRVKRHDTLSRRLPSKIANWLISVTTGVPLHDYGCTLKALRRDIAKELKLYGEMHRFIPALAASLGATIVEVPVRHHPRRHGRSNYGIGRTLRVLLDLMTVKFLSGYFTRPVHLFGLCGMLAVFSGTGITLVLAMQRLFWQTALSDRPLLLLGILLMIVGTQFITMGLLGEMLARVYHEAQAKPVYVIRTVLNAGDQEALPDKNPSPSPNRANSFQVMRAVREMLREAQQR